MEKTRRVLLDSYRNLHLSPSVRGLIITELASDVVQMTRKLSADGLSLEEAENVSLQTLAVTGKASLEMNRVHRRKFTEALVEMPRGVSAATAVLMSAGALISLVFVLRAGSIAGAAGGFVYTALATLFTALLLCVHRCSELFLKNKVMTRWGRWTETVLKMLATAVVSMPFILGAAELAGTDPLQAVHWLRTTSAMLSTGLASGVLIFMMLVLIHHRKASLLSMEKHFAETLESILEELI